MGRGRGHLRPSFATATVAWCAAGVLGALVAGCSGRTAPAPLETATPLASLRPSPPPAPPWSPAARAAAHRDLDAVFADDTLANAGLVVLADDGSVLYSRHATQPMTPASTLKLVVAAAAFDLLGPQHRFETSLVALDGPDALGALHGPLWLVGGGDPWLRSDDLRGGAGVLRRVGVQRVEDGLLVDASAFGGPEQNPKWDPDDLNEGYAAATSAISLDQGTTEFDVTPESPGDAARVAVAPPNDDVAVSGTIRTVGEGDDTSLTIDRKGDAPAARNAFVIDGRIPVGETQKFWKPILGTARYAGGALAGMLIERGIALAGGVGEGLAPLAGRTLWLHRSPPLADIVREMLVNSNNHTAEQLLRAVGVRAARLGTDAAGVATERRELARLGVTTAGMRVFDGSGLAPSDRVTALTLAETLLAELHGPNRDVYVQSLARVGMDGTVRNHDVRDALGRARAKSGHLQGVNALAGIVSSARHGRLTFAFIENGPSSEAGAVYQAQDRAMDAMADF